MEHIQNSSEHSVDIIGHLADAIVYPINIFGVDLSISRETIVLFCAATVVFLLLYVGGRNAKTIPSRLQNFVEILVLGLWEYLEPIVHDRRWLPFFLAIFLLIFTSNLIGFLPGVVPPTGNINFTATLAIIVFFASHVAGIISKGFFKYFGGFIPKGVPKFIIPILIPIEILSHLSRPFSLSIRLFANIFAGHAVVLTFLSLILVFKSVYVIPASLMTDLAVSVFELFIAFIQAFIFTFLSAFYIGDAINSEH